MKITPCILFILILIICNHHFVLTQVTLANFRQEALAEHNAKRQLHCTGPMTLDDALNTVAQDYAQHLADTDQFVHSNTPGLGENLFKMSSSDPITSLSGKRQINR